MTEHDQKEAFKGCIPVALIALLVLFFTSASEAQQWRTSDVPIYYNDAGNPFTQQDVINAISYASWLADERTGSSSFYAGLNGLTTPDLDTAQVIWEILSNGAIGNEMAWTYTSDGKVAKSLVRLNPEKVDSYCLEYVTVHEIAHALSMSGHVSQFQELMSAYPDVVCKAGLGQVSANLSSYTGGDQCFVELLPSGDLFVPNYNGMAAYLWQTGEHEWSLYHYYPAGDQTCSTVSMQGADIIMTDVRGYPGVSYSLVELYSIGNDKWRLRYAE